MNYLRGSQIKRVLKSNDDEASISRKEEGYDPV